MKFIIASVVAALMTFMAPAVAQQAVPTMADVSAAVAADAARAPGTESTLAADVAEIIVANPALAQPVANLAQTLPPAQQAALVQAFAIATVALANNPSAQAAVSSIAAAAFGEAFTVALAGATAASTVAAGGPGGGAGPAGATSIGGGGGGGSGSVADPNCPSDQVSPNCPS